MLSQSALVRTISFSRTLTRFKMLKLVIWIFRALFNAITGNDLKPVGCSKFNFQTQVLPTMKESDLNVVLKTDDFVAFFPSNPRNENLGHVNDPDDLMALDHLLVVPRADGKYGRKWNAVSLGASDIQMLCDMKEVGEQANTVLYLRNDAFYKKLCQENNPLDFIERMKNGTNSQKRMLLCPEAFKCGVVNGSEPTMSQNIWDDNEDYVQFCLHLSPDNSVGGLHMHVFTTTYATVGYDKHSHKNVHVDTVMEELAQVADTRSSSNDKFLRLRNQFRCSSLYYTVWIWEHPTAVRGMCSSMVVILSALILVF